MSDTIITLIEDEPSLPTTLFEMLKAVFCNSVDILETIFNLF